MDRLELGKQLSSASEQADQPQRKWFSVHEPPDDVIEYPKEGLLGYINGTGLLAEHGWQ